MRQIVRTLAWATALLVAMPGSALPLGPPTSGASPPDAAAELERIERGGRSFSIHCQSCHGPEARGVGPMAEVLKVQVPDLTRLAARRGGSFPEDEVHRIIDGRTLIQAHGARKMPVWGLTFQQPGRAANQESEVYERIRDLTAFLRSIQQPPR